MTLPPYRPPPLLKFGSPPKFVPNRFSDDLEHFFFFIQNDPKNLVVFRDGLNPAHFFFSFFVRGACPPTPPAPEIIDPSTPSRSIGGISARRINIDIEISVVKHT